jgi:hypothetical protein
MSWLLVTRFSFSPLPLFVLGQRSIWPRTSARSWGRVRCLPQDRSSAKQKKEEATIKGDGSVLEL